MIANDKTTTELFNKTAQLVVETAIRLSEDPDQAAKTWPKGMAAINDHVLDYFRRMRGGEIVSMIMGQLSKEDRAKAISTSLRGKLAAVTAANAQQKKKRKVEPGKTGPLQKLLTLMTFISWKNLMARREMRLAMSWKNPLHCMMPLHLQWMR
jgi:hypothetical protein